MNKFSNVTVPNDLGAFSNAELRKLENQIARKHSGNVPWEIVIWGFGKWEFSALLFSHLPTSLRSRLPSSRIAAG